MSTEKAETNGATEYAAAFAAGYDKGRRFGIAETVAMMHVAMNAYPERMIRGGCWMLAPEGDDVGVAIFNHTDRWYKRGEKDGRKIERLIWKGTGDRSESTQSVTSQTL